MNIVTIIISVLGAVHKLALSPAAADAVAWGVFFVVAAAIILSCFYA